MAQHLLIHHSTPDEMCVLAIPKHGTCTYATAAAAAAAAGDDDASRVLLLLFHNDARLRCVIFHRRIHV